MPVTAFHVFLRQLLRSGCAKLKVVQIVLGRTIRNGYRPKMVEFSMAHPSAFLTEGFYLHGSILTLQTSKGTHLLTSISTV